MTLQISDRAPEFTAYDQLGRLLSLSDYRGKWVVLYFYSKDYTSGCTRQACAFRDAIGDMSACGAEVIGVSPDSVATHHGFAEKYALPFRLIADPDRSIAHRYGVVKEKKLYGRSVMGIERTTFIIDPQGRIAAIFPKVRVDGHVGNVLHQLHALTGKKRR